MFSIILNMSKLIFHLIFIQFKIYLTIINLYLISMRVYIKSNGQYILKLI